MADLSVVSVARETKALQQTLKECVGSHDPWDKEVEFHRRNLQKQYLLLLLSFPYAKESKDAETHLWMQTTYALITSYKLRISAVEDALRDASAQRQQSKQQQQRHGPVEHRKLLQRLKQFLANEEKFWSQLVTRLHHQFDLTEADSALSALGISTSGDAGVLDAEDDTHRGQDRSSHFKFPAEPAEPYLPATPEQRVACLATLAKALICLGDLARYREQYSEPKSRRQDESSKRGNRRGGRQSQAPPEIRPKTYDRARVCYERARHLVPDEGNASHQLAILALYQKDTFECLVHYYRAFCVRVSYEPASENLGNVLSRFLRIWKGRRSKGAAETVVQSKNRLDTLKDDIVALHALWKQGANVLDKFPDVETNIVSEFKGLVTDRALPIDIITKTILLVQGAHWHHKSLHSQSTSESKAATSLLQNRILTHILTLYTALFQVGIQELQESSRTSEEDLAMHITAVFRRMLPALRITVKWLHANSILDFFRTADHYTTPTLVVDAFRSALSTFGERLATTFPPPRLPQLNRPLEEDLELAGYLPLGGLLRGRTPKDPNDNRTLEEVHPNEEQLMRISDILCDVSYLVPESRSRAPAQTSSFRSQSQSYRHPEKETINSDGPPSAQHLYDENGQTDPAWQIQDRPLQDDDARTETTDPIGDVFRQAPLSSDTESEQDEVVWNPRSAHFAASQPISKPAPQQASDPSPGRFAPSGLDASVATDHIAISQSLSYSLPGVAGNLRASTSPRTPKTTAQDLLANVLSSGRTPSRSRHGSQSATISTSHLKPLPLDPSAFPQSQPFLGRINPSTSFGPGPSIWSASPNEGSLGTHHRHTSHPEAALSTSMARAGLSQSSPNTWSELTNRVQRTNEQQMQAYLNTNVGYGLDGASQRGGYRTPSSTIPARNIHPFDPLGYNEFDIQAGQMAKHRQQRLVGLLPPEMDSVRVSAGTFTPSQTVPGAPLSSLSQRYNLTADDANSIGSLSIGNPSYINASRPQVHRMWDGAG